MSPVEQPPRRLFHVKFASRDEPVVIEADTICEDRNPARFVFKRDGEEVGRIKSDAVEGWWVEEKSAASSE